MPFEGRGRCELSDRLLLPADPEPESSEEWERRVMVIQKVLGRHREHRRTGKLVCRTRPLALRLMHADVDVGCQLLPARRYGLLHDLDTRADSARPAGDSCDCKPCVARGRGGNVRLGLDGMHVLKRMKEFVTRSVSCFPVSVQWSDRAISRGKLLRFHSLDQKETRVAF